MEPKPPLNDGDSKTQLILEIISQIELEQILKGQVDRVSSDLVHFRQAASRVQQSVEIEEEHISNVLFRRLGSQKREKELLQEKVRVEETLTSKLRAKLDCVKREKAEIDVSLESEQEYIIHNLHRKLAALATRKACLDSQLQQERAAFLANVHELLEQKMATTSPTSTRSSAEHQDHTSSRFCQRSRSSWNSLSRQNSEMQVLQLEKDVVKLLGAQREAERRAAMVQQESENLTKRLERLKADSFIERARAAKAKEDLERFCQEADEQSRELERLRQSPSLQSQGDSTTATCLSSASGLSGVTLDRGALRAHTERVLSAATIGTMSSASQVTATHPAMRSPSGGGAVARSTTPPVPGVNSKRHLEQTVVGQTTSDDDLTPHPSK